MDSKWKPGEAGVKSFLTLVSGQLNVLSITGTSEYVEKMMKTTMVSETAVLMQGKIGN